MRNSLHLLILTFWVPLPGICQQDSNFLVTYSYKQKIAINQTIDSSVNKATQINDEKAPVGSDSANSASAGEVLNLMDEFNFSVSAFIIANKDSSKTYFRLEIEHKGEEWNAVAQRVEIIK